MAFQGEVKGCLKPRDSPGDPFVCLHSIIMGQKKPCQLIQNHPKTLLPLYILMGIHIYTLIHLHKDFPVAQTVNEGDQGLIPGLGRSSGEGNGNPLQYSCLENPMLREACSPWGGKELDMTERLTHLIFPVFRYGYESWTIKKAERRRIDAFELWCWRRLLRLDCKEI